MRIGSVDYGYVLETRATIEGLKGISRRDTIPIRAVGSRSIGAHERVRKGAVGITVGSRIDTIA